MQFSKLMLRRCGVWMPDCLFRENKWRVLSTILNGWLSICCNSNINIRWMLQCYITCRNNYIRLCCVFLLTVLQPLEGRLEGGRYQRFLGVKKCSRTLPPDSGYALPAGQVIFSKHLLVTSRYHWTFEQYSKVFLLMEKLIKEIVRIGCWSVVAY